MNHRSNNSLTIVGAGPGGLAAAIVGAARGARVTVRERHGDVGHRFNSDFQGLENWTTEQDALDELEQLGIEPDFEYNPFHALTVFDPDGRAHHIRSHKPLWYLVRRGSDRGTLDHSLKTQAAALGANLVFNDSVDHLPDGGIVAHGPRRPDVIAVGYIFDTTHSDGAYAVISNDLAPKGYSYLLISRGRATVAACLFDDFHNEKTYLNRTVAFFERVTGIDGSVGKRFGGFGSAYNTMTARRDNMLYVGEAAGLQDALFGFGIRLALLSGSMAASAVLEGRSREYDAACEARFGSLLRIGLTNRFIFSRMGDGGYKRFLRRIGNQSDVRDWLRRYYTKGAIRSFLSRYVVRQLRPAARPTNLTHDNCGCSWCRSKRR